MSVLQPTDWLFVGADLFFFFLTVFLQAALKQTRRDRSACETVAFPLLHKGRLELSVISRVN